MDEKFDMKKNFKLILAGDGCSGKTTFLKRLMEERMEGSKMDPKYIATLGVSVHPLKLVIDGEEYIFNCWDTAGQPKFGGIREGYYVNGQMVLVFVDLSNPSGIGFVYSDWYEDVKRVCGDIPTVFIGSKLDLDNYGNWEKFKKYCDKKGYDHVAICTKEYYNMHKPFERLIQQVSNK